MSEKRLTVSDGEVKTMRYFLIFWEASTATTKCTAILAQTSKAYPNSGELREYLQAEIAKREAASSDFLIRITNIQELNEQDYQEFTR